MDTNSSNSKCAVVVSSFDGCADLWEPFFTLFFRYWPDCPYPIYLISNFKIFHHQKVNTITVGTDQKWASNARTALDRIPATRIIYLQDDYFLTEPVDTRRIQKLLDVDAACIRLFPQPGPDLPYDEELGKIGQRADYRISLQAAIWDKEKLRELLRPGESGWDMEIEGTKRSHGIDSVFLSVKNPAVNYIEGATKGKWNIPGLWHCFKESARCKLTARPVNWGIFYRAQRDRLRKFLNQKHPQP